MSLLFVCAMMEWAPGHCFTCISSVTKDEGVVWVNKSDHHSCWTHYKFTTFLDVAEMMTGFLKMSIEPPSNIQKEKDLECQNSICLATCLSRLGGRWGHQNLQWPCHEHRLFCWRSSLGATRSESPRILSSDKTQSKAELFSTWDPSLFSASLV